MYYDIYWSFAYYDLRFGNLVNYYLNRLKTTYLNSLNDWFNFIHFYHYNYIFIELKVLLILINILTIKFLMIYPVYFELREKFPFLYYIRKISYKNLNLVDDINDYKLNCNFLVYENCKLFVCFSITFSYRNWYISKICNACKLIILVSLLHWIFNFTTSFFCYFLLNWWLRARIIFFT